MKKITFVLAGVAAAVLLSCETAVSVGGGEDGDGGGGSGVGNSGGGVNKYTLSVSASPASGGSVSRSPNQASYDAGTSVTVTANPANGWKFSNWTGASSSASSSISVKMDDNKTLTAVFTQRQVASAVIITLTYWASTDTDVGGLDPTIYFRVSYGSTTKTTETLLYETDIGQSWSGSSSSSPVSFSTSASSIRIEAVVKERDLLFDDDISPGTSSTISLPKYVGDTGTLTLGYGSGKSTVTYRYEFVQ